MIFATTLTVTAIKPRLLAEKGANSPFLQKPVKCTNSELENSAFKGSHRTLQGQAPVQLLSLPPPHVNPSFQSATATLYSQCFSPCWAFSGMLFFPFPLLTCSSILQATFQTPPDLRRRPGPPPLIPVSAPYEELPHVCGAVGSMGPRSPPDRSLLQGKRASGSVPACAMSRWMSEWMNESSNSLHNWRPTERGFQIGGVKAVLPGLSVGDGGVEQGNFTLDFICNAYP